jgi:hypothetical protein
MPFSLLTFILEPTGWTAQPGELLGANGQNNRGSSHVVFSQINTLDETYIMNGKPLFTISNPNNQKIK